LGCNSRKICRVYQGAEDRSASSWNSRVKCISRDKWTYDSSAVWFLFDYARWMQKSDQTDQVRIFCSIIRISHNIAMRSSASISWSMHLIFHNVPSQLGIRYWSSRL
jgi:hypothetical protein